MAASMKPGDWRCLECSNHNFASREVCNRCQADKPVGHQNAHESSKKGGLGGSNYGAAVPSTAPNVRPVPYNQAFAGCNGFGKQISGMRQGDWLCMSCANYNFASRTLCNKCKMPNAMMFGGDFGVWGCGGCFGGMPMAPFSGFYPGGPSNGRINGSGGSSVRAGGGCGGMPMNIPAMVGATSAVSSSSNKMKVGDWMCTKCGNHNFASRIECNVCKNMKAGAKKGDWICRSCRNHNFACRDCCNKCHKGKRDDEH
eukprot:TRINITY_DN63730_c0_g1_i1.p1 TRINITY_DN63730_c0_g1~~TRINITY_DN63730_c0_g1_i1.p1  ORF type:complete len:256 (+),score=28.39 TRINITY_DN63730_c0_g1_i1:86-853(+)